MGPNANHPPNGPDPTPDGLPLVSAAGATLALRPNPTNPALTPTGGLDTTALLKAFRRCWAVAFVTAIVCGGTALLAAWFLIPSAKFTSQATLQVLPYRPRQIFTIDKPEPNPLTFLADQKALLRSRFVIDEALRDPKIAALQTVKAQEDPVEWLVKDLNVQSMPSASIISISLSGDQRVDLAPIVDAITDAYMRLVVEKERTEEFSRYEYLQKLWVRLQDELKAKRKHLKEMVETVGAPNQNAVELRQTFLHENLSATQAEINRVEREITQIDVALQVIEATTELARPNPAGLPGAALAASNPMPAVPRTIPDAILRADPQIQQRLDDIDQAQAEYDHGLRLAKRPNDDAYVVNARRRLDAAKAAYKQELADLQQRYESAINAPTNQALAANGAAAPGRAALTDPLAGGKIRKKSDELYLKALKEQFNKYQEELNGINIGSLDLKADEAEVAIAEETAKKVGIEIANLEVELQAPPRIRVLDEASVPTTKDDSKRLKMTGMAGLGAFGLAIFGITFMEYRARRIGSADEVVSGLGLRLVGALPPVPTMGVGRRRLLGLGKTADEHWRSRLVESVDATRTMLLHASRTEGIRVVMISSALKGEGKTSLSGHLATSLARAGRRTLLFDCDLRKPDIHRLFDVPAEPGLCEVLRGEVELHAAIQPTAAGELAVITAGRCDPIALQMLAQDGARAIFDALRHEFDFIVVDSAPVLPVADSLLLAQQVDAVLFSILRDVSCVPHVQTAYDRLSGLGARILGAVVNGAPSKGYSYSGNYPAYG